MAVPEEPPLRVGSLKFGVGVANRSSPIATSTRESMFTQTGASSFSRPTAPAPRSFVIEWAEAR